MIDHASYIVINGLEQFGISFLGFSHFRPISSGHVLFFSLLLVRIYLPNLETLSLFTLLAFAFLLFCCQIFLLFSSLLI